MNKNRGSIELIIAGVVAVLLLAAGAWFGYKYMDGEVQKQKAIALEATQRAFKWQEARDREKIVVRTVTKAAEKEIQTVTKFVEVIKEIPKEVACEKDSAGTTYLSAAWRVSHDAAVAAANGTPEAVYDQEHPAQGVTPGDALKAVVSNYSICAHNAIMYDAAAGYILDTYNHEVELLEKATKK